MKEVCRNIKNLKQEGFAKIKMKPNADEVSKWLFTISISADNLTDMTYHNSVGKPATDRDKCLRKLT